jgi:hypothetical protein
MKPFDRYSVVPFLLTLVIVGPVAFLGWQHSIDILYRWQTLATGMLALAGAAIVHVAAKWQISNERDLAKQARQDRVSAARMRVAYQLELLANDLVAIARRRRMFQGFFATESDLMPLPGYVASTADLTQLPPNESEAMLDLARRITAGNNLFLGKNDEVERFRVFAAVSAVTAIDWRNLFGAEVGWREMQFGKKRRKEMLEIIEKHKREAEEA